MMTGDIPKIFEPNVIYQKNGEVIELPAPKKILRIENGEIVK